MAVPNAASGRERFLVALINKAVTEYESGHTDLGQLVNDIESLIDSLEEGSDVSWVNALGHEWLSLARIVHQPRLAATVESEETSS